MDMLEAWGWDETWATRFTPHAQDGCVPARVSVEHRGLYGFYGPAGEGVAQVSGRLRHLASGRADFPAVGDWVALRLPTDPGPAVVEAVLSRTNKLSRKAPGGADDEQVLAANLDSLLLVTSLNRDLNPRRVERFLAAASLPGCRPVLVLTKSDLCESAAALAEGVRARLGGVPVHAVSALAGEGLDDLTPYLGGRRTVAMLGTSGVGKSTLLNRLAGRDLQEVRPVRAWDDRGRHTTTRRELVPLPQGGLLIDSPGLREFQLWGETADVDAAFEDVARLAADCPFADCSHTHEPRCAVRQAIADGRLDEARYESYLKLRKELEYEESRTDARAGRERKERERQLTWAFEKRQRQQKER
jgi:ribosome biogenesis GTPase / thiamine phosphate phosphatase